MSWSLSASGHADDPEVEKRLAWHLGVALAAAGKAVYGVTFSGPTFSGDPRTLVFPAAPDGDEQA